MIAELGEYGMRINKTIVGTCVALVLTLGLAVGSLHVSAFAQRAQTGESVSVAVGPQYDTTHVYVAPEDFDRFVASLIATFGGTTTKQGVFTVTPPPSSTSICHRTERRRSCAAFCLSPMEPSYLMMRRRQALKSDGLRKPTGE